MSNITIGAPVENIPSKNYNDIPWDRIADAVNAADGAWVPVTLHRSDTSYLSSVIGGIKRSTYVALRGSAYDAKQRKGVVWIRKVT